MKNSLAKDITRDIKKSLGRFVAIVAIVAIGVALFTGVKVSSPVMKKTLDNYYDEQNFMDMQLLSTFGFTEKDVAALKDIEGVRGIFPTYSMDVATTIDSTELVLKVHGIDLAHKEEKDENYINRPVLVEGRLPEKTGECVIEASRMGEYNIGIGSVIEVNSGKQEDIANSLKNSKYTVVGTVNSPSYVSFEKGSSSIGNGKVNSFMLIPNEDFKIEAFTEIFLTIDNVKELNTYEKDYDEIIASVKEKIEAVGIDRSKIRQLEIIDEGKEKLAKAKLDFEEGKKKSQEELAKAEGKLLKAEKDLKAGEAELIKQKSDFNEAIKAAEEQILQGEKDLAAGEAAYNKAYAEFQVKKQEAQVQIAEAEKGIKAGEETIAAIEGQIIALKDKIQNENLTEAEKVILKEQLSYLESVLEKTRESIEAAKAELVKQKQLLEDGEKQLAASKAQLEAGRNELESKKALLKEQRTSANAQFASAEEELRKGREELEKGKSEYESAKLKAEEEIAKGEKEIAKGEKNLKNIDMPKWYVLDRNTNYSYVDYENSANSIDAIAKVFPLFFVIVAALVCLTTMTRMVDEQRGTMGTLKALGYSKIAIMSKYIIYATFASVLGGLIGIAIGFTVFPSVILDAYRMMYQLSSIKLIFEFNYAALSIIVAILITTTAALTACYRELVETPALLMRPKAPQAGKRILLERIPFIWNRFNFLAKVSARNIFRYKKRFLMTVIGVAGCTALLLTGFGIKDSIKTIVNSQFGDIYKYHMTVDLDNKIDEEDYDSVLKWLQKEENIKEFMGNETLTVKAIGSKEKEATLFIPEKVEGFENFITLRKRVNKEKMSLSEEGVILNEKLAKQIGVKAGDSFKIDIGTKEAPNPVEVKVDGITEHYLYHYIYMSPTLYEKLSGKAPTFNHVIAVLNNIGSEVEESLAKDIINVEGVASINFNTAMKDSFNNMIKSLNYVMMVIIISAGALAFVVLYNLTNVNISERIREIATIKVLGFYDKEVSAYVYRESTILTLIGMLVGLGLGVILHRYIMVTVELDTIMFGRNINFISFIWSAALTMAFGIVVNLTMYYKLKNIPMVESLKSVD